MHAPHAYRGFTLIELIATITIIAILAAVALPRGAAATPFDERGYADTVAASLRQARVVAMATTCPVQYTIGPTGYSASQRAASGVPSGSPCAAVGAISTPLFTGIMPAGVTLAASQQFVFSSNGSIGAAVTITLGAQTITVNQSGIVQ